MPRGVGRAGSLFAAFSGAIALVAAVPGTAGSATTRGSGVTQLRISPPVLSARGDVTVMFRLAKPGPVVFSLAQVAPVRRSVGPFVVRGRAGPNRFRFPGRIDRRLLPPGTYRLTTRNDDGTTVRAAFAVAPNRDATAAAGADQRRDEAAEPLRPLVIACLLVAIPFLAVAALPLRVTPGPRSAAALAARRPLVAATGGVALGVAVALYAASLL